MDDNSCKKKSNVGLWVAAGICVFLVVLVIGAAVLIPRFAAESIRSDAEQFLAQSGEVRIALTDPLRGGDTLFSTAETTLSGVDAEALRDRLTEILQNCRYDETERHVAGVWYLSATVYIGDGQYRIYLEEDGIAFEKGDGASPQSRL